MRGDQDLNYRRFFNVSELVGLRVERPRVFDAVHAGVFRLAREIPTIGLRVDMSLHRTDDG